MKVRAIGKGFIYGIFRYPGSVFTLKSEKHFSDNWMEKVGDEVPLVVTQPVKRTMNNALMDDLPLTAVNKPPIPITELERMAVASQPVHEPIPGSDPVPEQPLAEGEVTEQEPEASGPPSGDQSVI